MANSTWNLQSRNFSPIHNILQGPIAERPDTAELNTVYLSTDEADGVLKMYWYDGSAWDQCNGIWHLCLFG
jgi:hypothetical protein